LTLRREVEGSARLREAFESVQGHLRGLNELEPAAHQNSLHAGAHAFAAVAVRFAVSDAILEVGAEQVGLAAAFQTCVREVLSSSVGLLEIFVVFFSPSRQTPHPTLIRPVPLPSKSIKVCHLLSYHSTLYTTSLSN
jgi:hypothetical protein